MIPFTKKLPGLKFVVSNKLEQFRVKTLLTKEEGTIRWLQTKIRPGDVVYDIGANIGIYTIVAAYYAGPSGLIYSFEPHVMNVGGLLRNIHKNKFTNRVKVVTCALHAYEGFFDFNYNSMESGSSGSQLGHVVNENGEKFSPIAIELKYATTVDLLISDGIIRSPDLVKLDVDGNELSILNGMEATLESSLRSVQVEVHPKDNESITQLLKSHNFELQERHYTLVGKKLLKEHGDPSQIIHNAVFSKEG